MLQIKNPIANKLWPYKISIEIFFLMVKISNRYDVLNEYVLPQLKQVIGREN